MSNVRFADAYGLHLDDLIDEVEVCCPRCGQRARVQHEQRGARFSCLHCGHSKVLGSRKRCFQMGLLYIGRLPENAVTVVGGPFDPYFHYPVWFHTEFEGHPLWAYNLRHLSLLEQHVGALLRERVSGDSRNKTIGSRLPRWMTAASNRRRVLQALARLRDKK